MTDPNDLAAIGFTTNNSDTYLSTDEFEDVQASLLLVRDALIAVKTAPPYWKWAILAAHSALQGACLCILTRSDGLGALTDASSEALADKLYGETASGRKIDDKTINWPEPRVEELPELLKRLPHDLRVSLPGRKEHSYGFELAGDLRRLHEFRNQFTHFSSTGWSIEIGGLPRMIERAINLTRCITTSPHFSRYNRFSEMELEPLFDEILGLLPKP